MPESPELPLRPTGPPPPPRPPNFQVASPLLQPPMAPSPDNVRRPFAPPPGPPMSLAASLSPGVRPGLPTKALEQMQQLSNILNAVSASVTLPVATNSIASVNRVAQSKSQLGGKDKPGEGPLSLPGNVPMAAVPAMPQPPKPDTNLFKVRHAELQSK